MVFRSLFYGKMKITFGLENGETSYFTLILLTSTCEY